MKTVNIYDDVRQIAKWANLNSQMNRKLDQYEKDAEIDLVLQVKNKYSQINYTYDELPDSLEELLNDFPEAIDLEYCIYENGVSTGRIGFLKKFEEVKEESDSTKVELNSNTPNSLPKQETKKESESGQTVTIDVNQLFEKYSSSLQSVVNQNNKPEPVRQENQNSDLVESLRQQIADLKQIHSAQISELKDFLKEAKDETKLANSQLFTLQMENVRLSMQAAQNINPQSVDAKVEEAVRAMERNQKKLNEQTDAKKAELEALNLKVIETRVKSEIKNNPNNTEIDKAVADIIRNKVPSLIDRGIDLMTALPKANGKEIAATPII